MLFTTDQVTALATARNNAQPLSDAMADKAPDRSSDRTKPSVASTTESLAAVIPTGVVGLYTLMVLPIKQYAEKAATTERANKAAELAKDPENSKAEIKAALARLTQESDDWIRLRWGLLVLTAIVVVALGFQAARAANQSADMTRKLPLAEAGTAVLAFLAWALATPGTPLAAHYVADDMNIVSGAIVGVSALLLLALGKGVLSKPAVRVKEKEGSQDPVIEDASADLPDPEE